MKTKLLILSFAVLCLAAVPASAAMFTLNYSALSKLWQVNENPLDSPQPGSTFLIGNTATSPAMSYPVPMGGIVGYKAQLDEQTGFQQIQIGANFWGSSTTGGTGNATTADVIGAALGTTPTNDLSGFTGYSLTFFNDNDDDWMVNLYMNTGYTDPGWWHTDRYYENSWTTIGPGGSASLVLDFLDATSYEWDPDLHGPGQGGNIVIPHDSIVNLGYVTNIGFNIGGNMGVDPSPPNPSVTDFAHISVVPVPAAVLLGILGLSAVGLKLRKYA